MFFKTKANLVFSPDGGGNGGSGSGGEEPAWAAQLEGDLQNNEVLTGFKTISDLGKAHLEAGERIRTMEEAAKGMVALPGENATDEERTAFFTKMGRPESADKYTFTKPEMPEGMPYSEDVEKAFRTMAHGLNLSQEQAKGLFEGWNKLAVENYKAESQRQADEQKAALDALQKEWGDGYKGRMEKAMRLAEKIGTPFKDWLNRTGIGDDPEFIKAFDFLASKISDDALPGEGGPGEGGTGDDLKALAEKAYPYMKKG